MKRFAIPLLVGLCALFVAVAWGERWPMGPGDEPNPLGNNYGEYQDYGKAPYYHDGLDTMGEGGDDTFSVSDGYVVYKQSYEPYYSGIMISDTYGNGDGWLYWHITYSTMPYNVGDYVEIDDYIGDIATWPVAEFHHCHFTRMYFNGSWYDAIGNPQEFMEPDTDDDPPTFADAYESDIFAFRENTLSNPDYYDPQNLSGEVDIVALIRDKVGHPTWDLVPYEIEYWIEGDGGSVPLTTTVLFTGDIPLESTVTTIFSDDSTCDSHGDYSNRDFYFIITNTDGDGVVETSDGSYSWDTTLLPDGEYTVYVQAYDEYGNQTTEQMDVTVANDTTDVVITQFWCQDSEGAILVSWTTEEEDLSFNLYRRLARSEASTSIQGSSHKSLANSAPSSFEGYKLVNPIPIMGNSPYHYLDEEIEVGVRYEYLLEAIEEGRSSYTGPTTGMTEGVIPHDFSLAPNYPNPFTDITTIVFTLPRASKVELALYDLSGRLVRRVLEGEFSAGEYHLPVDASDMSSGIYILTMKAGDFSSYRRIVKAE